MVTAPEPAPAPASAPGLLGKLMAAVRPEFRADIFVPERGALVFGAAPCRVPGCVRQPRTRGFCKGHYYRWKDAGRPGIDEELGNYCRLSASCDVLNFASRVKRSHNKTT